MNITKAQIVDIDQNNFNSEVLGSKQPVLVAFLAAWSRPCRIIGSVLDEVAHAGTVKVAKIDADDFPDLGIWYDIRSVPTLLCFVNGEVYARIVGTASKEAILRKVQTHLPKTSIETSPAHPNDLQMRKARH